MAVVDGKAQIDTDGDGAADSGLGIDDAERARLAATRHVGDELWRVPIDHFSPWDHNWPYAPTPDAVPPTPPEPRVDVPTNRKQGECNKAGSIIGCQGQTLCEELPVIGAPFNLRYDSRRAGRKTDRSIEIPLTGRSIPESLEAVHVHVTVAGRTEKKILPAKKDLVYEYVWDRRDAYGREVQGRQPVDIRIGFQSTRLREYGNPAEWNAAFGKFTNNSESSHRRAARRRGEVRQLARRCATSSASPSAASTPAAPASAAGSSTVHHAYDARMRTLYRGDGQEVGAESVLDTLAGTGKAGDPRDADVAPDGSVWVANAATDQVIRFDKDGNGGGHGRLDGRRRLPGLPRRAATKSSTDDPLAKGFPLARPMSVALTPDGGFYVADYLVDWGVQQSVIYRVEPRRAGSARSPAACAHELGDGGPRSTPR